jgi:hypothetical protein
MTPSATGTAPRGDRYRDWDRTLRRARGAYAVAQMAPGVALFVFGTVGYLQVVHDEPAAGLGIYFAPVAVLAVSGWFMARNWDRPGSWERGAASAGTVMGFLAGAVAAIGAGAAGLPPVVVVLALICGSTGGSVLVWLPVRQLRVRLLDVDVDRLAQSNLTVPFRVRKHANVTFEVGLDAVHLTGRYAGYRSSMLDRVRRAERPLHGLGSVKATTETETDEVWCPVARYGGTLSVSPGPVLRIGASHGADPWVLPIDDAPRAAELVHLRQHPCHDGRQR